MFKFLLSIFFSGCFCLGMGCKKEPGVGGSSAISGKIYAKDFNAFCQLEAEYYSAEERVYIIYGNDSIYDNDMRTSYDGSYRFEYLNKGTYTIFAYSKTDTCKTNEIEAVKKTVEITDKKQVVNVEDINIIK